MNQILEGICADDIRAMRKSSGMSMNECKQMVVHERIMSGLSFVQILIEQDKLKEAILLQNDIILTMLKSK